MKKFRRVVTLLVTLFVCFVFVPVALAHPLGNLTVNQYAGLQIGREAVVLDYVLDLAEIPAVQEISTFDANGNGRADFVEAAGYHAGKCAALEQHLSLLLNKRALDLTLTSSAVEFPAGVGGLPTLRLTCEFQAALDAQADSLQLSFRNNAYPDRLGWQEIVVIPNGVTLQGDFSSVNTSNRLTEYPQDLLTSPLEQRQVEFQVITAGLPAQGQPARPTGQSQSPAVDRNDAFTRLILLEDINISTFLLALAISFLWGAMHAMTPGHGKTIVGAYLIGSRGTLKHAVYLGLITTITHTLGVFALGLVTLFAAHYVVPETLYPWMSLLSGLFVVGIGLNLLGSRLKSSGVRIPKVKAYPAKPSYMPVFQHVERIGHRHAHVLNSSQEEFHAHDIPHSHAHEQEQDHDHGRDGHSHLPPGAEGSPVTWRSLLALGVSGGLIPCPSALIVLLGAIALNRIGFGLVLVLAFSLGLAGALTAIGMIFIYAGRLFNGSPARGWTGAQAIMPWLPALSAIFVSAIGVGIVLKALGEIG